jgi:hypothetical protein
MTSKLFARRNLGNGKCAHSDVLIVRKFHLDFKFFFNKVKHHLLPWGSLHCYVNNYFALKSSE